MSAQLKTFLTLLLSHPGPVATTNRDVLPVPEAVTPATLRRVLEFIYTDGAAIHASSLSDQSLTSPDLAMQRTADSLALSTAIHASPHAPPPELAPSCSEEATHLLHAADHFSLPRLLAIASSFLASSLAVDNAAAILTLAEQHGVRPLRDAAARFVGTHAVDVMNTPGWGHMKEACAFVFP